MKPPASFALRLCLLSLLSLATVGRLQGQAPAAQLVSTINTSEDLPVVAAWAPDGQRLAYGTEKEVQRRRPPLSVDEGPIIHYPGEVWVTDLQDKPRRILKHDFLRTQEGDFFSFSIERLAWSPG